MVVTKCYSIMQLILTYPDLLCCKLKTVFIKRKYPLASKASTMVATSSARSFWIHFLISSFQCMSLNIYLITFSNVAPAFFNPNDILTQVNSYDEYMYCFK